MKRTRALCDIDGCDRAFYANRLALGLCSKHYQRWHPTGEDPRPTPQPLAPVVVVCPDDLMPLITQLVENDARPIFRLLWRAIGEWHLAGLLEEQSA